MGDIAIDHLDASFMKKVKYSNGRLIFYKENPSDITTDEIEKIISKDTIKKKRVYVIRMVF